MYLIAENFFLNIFGPFNTFDIANERVEMVGKADHLTGGKQRLI